MMGGTRAHEYMAPCAAGENDVALAPGYAANVEIASAEPQPVALPEPEPAPELVHTPGATTIEAVAGQLGVPAGALLKAFPVVTEARGLVMVFVRGDHRVNEIKLHERARRAVPARRARTSSPSASARRASSARSARTSPCCSTTACAPRAATIAGANEPDHHLRGVQPGRDFAFERVDVRTVEAGDRVDGQPITIEPAIEVGNIFKLGTRYSEPLGATYLDENGKEQLVVDGLLRHRPGADRRRRGRAVRRRAGHLVAALARAVGRRDRRARQAGQRRDAPPPRRSTTSCAPPASTSLLDDRDAGPGEKFADAELLGCPLRLTVGKRIARSAATAEAQVRRGATDSSSARRSPLTGGGARPCGTLWRPTLRLTFRRLFGLDRSGPPPPATLRGAPWSPWTIPNVDRLRPARAHPGLPRRSRSRVGRRHRPAGRRSSSPSSRGATTLDGIAARVTGQYSRFGALLDPLVDRLLVAVRRGRLLALRAAAALGCSRCSSCARSRSLVLARVALRTRHGPADQLAGPRWRSGRSCRRSSSRSVGLEEPAVDPARTSDWCWRARGHGALRAGRTATLDLTLKRREIVVCSPPSPPEWRSSA